MNDYDEHHDVRDGYSVGGLIGETDSFVVIVLLVATVSDADI